jgi:hypothetical protein
MRLPPGGALSSRLVHSMLFLGIAGMPCLATPVLMQTFSTSRAGSVPCPSGADQPSPADCRAMALLPPENLFALAEGRIGGESTHEVHLQDAGGDWFLHRGTSHGWMERLTPFLCHSRRRLGE